jgi:hypothetical protein
VGGGWGDGAWGMGPNPQSPIPNPQSPIPISLSFLLNYNIIINFNIINYKINSYKIFFKIAYLMAINVELGHGLDYVAFAIGILYTIAPMAFFCQYSAGLIKPKKVAMFGLLFLYLNGLTYFLCTIQSDLKKQKDIELRDFTNLSGAILGLFYCLYYSFLVYFKNNKKRFLICLGLIIGTLLILVLISFFVPVNILEYIAVVFNILEYTPLGFNLIYLIRNKVSEKYTLFSAIPGIINTIIWLVWAILKTIKENEKKYHSLVANILGFLLCALQFIMFFFFKKEEDDISDTLIQEGEMKVDVKEEEEKEKIQEEINKKEKSEYDDFL